MKYLFVVPMIFAVIILLISSFLQPNDLARCGESSTQGKCSKVDAIVAVSGGDTSARAKEAISLYKKSWASKIIFSGAALDESGPSNAKAMKKLALDAGIADENVLVEETSVNTKENAKNSKDIFTSQQIKSIILVTSGYHQRRAYIEFHRSSPTLVIRNHPVANDKDWSIWWWTNFHGWSLALGELTKDIVLSFGGGK